MVYNMHYSSSITLVKKRETMATESSDIDNPKITSEIVQITTINLEGSEENTHSSADSDFSPSTNENIVQRPTIMLSEEILQKVESRNANISEVDEDVVNIDCKEQTKLVLSANLVVAQGVVNEGDEVAENKSEDKSQIERIESENYGKSELTKDSKLSAKVVESSGCLKRKKPFPPFCALHPYRFGKWNLCARVKQKLNIQQYTTKKRMKLLLVDAEGTKIEASMWDAEVDRLQNLVDEGKVYTFTAVDVKNAMSQYKLVKSDVECFLTKETEIEEQEDDNSIPMFSFKFVTFDRLHAFEGTKHLLIDVMAMVREVGPLYYKQSTEKQIAKRDILLVDKTLQHVKLVVSDKLAMLDSDWKFALGNGAIIVATTLLVNSFGSGFMVLYGSYNSRVFFSPPIKDLEKIRMSIMDGLQSREIVSCSIGGANMIPLSLSCATRITIKDLKEFSSFDNNKVLPVVRKGTRAQIVDSSLRMSLLWPSIRKLHLTQNMRALLDPQFLRYLLRIGDGTEESLDGELVRIPQELIIPYNSKGDPKQQLIDSIFPALNLNGRSSDYIISMAILSIRNEYVDELNRKMIEKFSGDEMIYYSFDKAEDDTANHYTM